MRSTLPPNIVEDYEQLRAMALDGATGYGVTLLMHHGLCGWAQAGHPLATPGVRTPSGSRSAVPTGASNRALVRVLAAIVLSVHEERNCGSPTRL